MDSDGAAALLTIRLRLHHATQVELADQAAVIECTGGFFRWFDDSGKLPQQFTIDTIPPPSFFQTPNSRYAVLSLFILALY